MISMTVNFEVFNKNFKNSRSHCDQMSKTGVALEMINICSHFRKFTFSLENREKGERERGKEIERNQFIR